MREKIVGIYAIKNKINNKFYIGISIDIKRRWLTHVRDFNKQQHYNEYLQNAWHKYGGENFEFIILEQLENIDNHLLNEKEKFWIENYNSYNDGYNLTIGGDSEFFVSYETREKIRQKNIERKEFGENNPFSKLTNEQVLEIVKYYNDNKNISQEEIAQKYNVCRQTINNILSGKSWNKITGIVYVKKNIIKLNEEQILDILKCYDNKESSIIELSEKYNIKYGTVYSIVTGRRNKKITNLYLRNIREHKKENR